MSEKIKSQEAVNEKTERLVAKLFDHCVKHEITCIITADVNGDMRVCATGSINDIVSHISALIEHDEKIATAFAMANIVKLLSK